MIAALFRAPIRESALRYFSEILAAWRPLLAAMIGMGTGMSVVGTVTSAIAPSLVADAGWTKSQFAMVGSLALMTAFAMPFIGRLADVLGVRLTAGIGLLTLPIAYFGFSLIGGSFTLYVIIFFLQSMLCVTTTATVYTRLVVQNIVHARGLALAIVACGPAIAGAVGGPLLNSYVEANGWEASYRLMAIIATVTGIAVFLLIPPQRHPASAAGTSKRRAREDYPEIFRTPAFWVLFGTMILCNLPQTLLLVQLKMLVLDNGVTGEGASIMFTALSLGMLAGRFITGVALDRWAPHIVSFVTLALPSLGLYVLASSFDAPTVVTLAVFSLGFAVGAEGDIVAFLVARHFRVEVYSSVMGLMTAVISFSTASGAALLSWTMAETGSFDRFLIITGTSVLIGATLLLRLGGGGMQHRQAATA